MGLNPGTHVIAVTRSGYADSWESVTVREGEERTLAIEPPPVAQTLPLQDRHCVHSCGLHSRLVGPDSWWAS